MRVSAVVRTYNSARTLGACITSLRSQTLPAEIVVVDSGSTDDTVGLSHELADRVIRIPQPSYTPGYALNLGISATSGDVVLILSSHCMLADQHHAERVVDTHELTGAAATNGYTHDPWRRAISDVFCADEWPLNNNVFWGFSNHSSSILRGVWEHVPFQTEIPACEDKEWALTVHRSGYRVAYSAQLLVSTYHRRSSYGNLLARSRLEAACIKQILGEDNYRKPRAVRLKLTDFPRAASTGGKLTNGARCLRPARLVEAFGCWRGL